MAEQAPVQRVRARNLLSSYYGVVNDDGPSSTAAADDDDVRAAHAEKPECEAASPHQHLDTRVSFA